MRGGKDSYGLTQGKESSRVAEKLILPDKGKSLVPEGETTVLKAGRSLHKKVTQIGTVKYTHEELEKVRANAKYAGLGFYGIHDDDTLRTVLNGGDYDPLSDNIPPPVMEETFREIIVRRREMSSEEQVKPGKKPIPPLPKKFRGGTPPHPPPHPPPQQQRPVLAISNYANFCQRCNRQNMTPYYEGLRTRVFGYLKEDEQEEEDVTINAMHVMTAPMHRAGSVRPREHYLKHFPALFRAHMIDLFGNDRFGGFFNVHFCDPGLECVVGDPVIGSMNDFVNKVALPSGNSSFDVFKVDHVTIKDDIINFIKENGINLIYFIGGETHWLNRQLTKCKFKEVLEGLEDAKIVFGGYSAGLINLGSSSYITACKNFMYPDSEYFDDVSDLCDAEGQRIADIDVMSGPKEEEPGCAPYSIGDMGTEIKYDTLGVSPHVYFPHFDLSYINFLEYVEDECKKTANIVLTDGMMAYTNENGYTSFIFADIAVHRVLENGNNEFKIGETESYSAVIDALGDW